jgi:hypothetical protein
MHVNTVSMAKFFLGGGDGMQRFEHFLIVNKGISIVCIIFLTDYLLL